MTINSVVDERTLREITLVPFELAVREGGALGIMTAYNRLNGAYCAEHEWLLADVLRGEWGFEGFVDLRLVRARIVGGFGHAPGSTSRCRARAASTGPRSPTRCATARSTSVRRRRGRRACSRVFDRLGALDDAAGASRSRSTVPSTARSRARRGRVDGAPEERRRMLPLDPSSIATLAVIGPNAEQARIMGGGSASFAPHYRVPPLDALQERVGADVDDRLRAGLRHRADRARRSSPTSTSSVDGGARARARRRDGRLIWLGGAARRRHRRSAPTALARRAETAGTARASRSCSSARRACCSTARSCSTASPIRPPRGRELFGMGSEADRGDRRARRRARTSSSSSTSGEREPVGCSKACRSAAGRCRRADLLERAVAAAAGADAAIVVVGTNDDWESEGHDREFMDLPGDQDELIRRVAAANPRTVVVGERGVAR